MNLTRDRELDHLGFLISCILVCVSLGSIECLPQPQPQPKQVSKNANLGPSSQWHSRQQQQQQQQVKLDSLFGQLTQLEQTPAESLADCARWFQLDTKYNQLGGKELARESRLRKIDECDSLRDLYAETRAKIANYGRLVGAHTNELDFVGALTNELLDLKYAASANAQLAREFQSMLKSDKRVELATERLEQFIQFMQTALATTSQSQAGERNTSDELSDLDSSLKQLIDREDELADSELDELIELGSVLEQILADGYVNLNSARFRYLSGTLDAVRALILRRLGPQAGPLEEQRGVAAAPAV